MKKKRSENGLSSANLTKINLFFSHTSAILPFLSNFGIGKSENNFNSSNIADENPNRAYKLSKLDPMNSNIVFVLYSCQSSTPGDTKSEYIVRAFHNENLVKLEACQTTDCRFDELSSYLNSITQRCVSSENVCALN